MSRRLYCVYTSTIRDRGKWLVILREERSDEREEYKELRVRIYRDHGWFTRLIKKNYHKKISTKYSLRKIKKFITHSICVFSGYYYIMYKEEEINVVDILTRLMQIDETSIIGIEKIISGFLDDDN